MLKSAITTILNSYIEASSAQKRSAFAKSLAAELNVLSQGVLSSLHICKIGLGVGNWPKVPWIAIFDSRITQSAERGIYPVYLFREDLSSVYLSLNQGVTGISRKFGRTASRELIATAKYYGGFISGVAGAWDTGRIVLRSGKGSGLPAMYEKGSIVSKEYKAKALPSEEVLIADLLEMLAIYERLRVAISLPVGDEALEDDEVGLDQIVDEDYGLIAEHKRIERSRHIANQVKRALGYKCQACQFDYRKAYPLIKLNKYIEAHHLQPIATLRGKKVRLDIRKDFAVLCANCHRMIHRSDDPSDLDSFRRVIKQSGVIARKERR